MIKTNELAFTPALGLASKHLQMILSASLPAGQEPPSERLLVDIGQGEKLSCHVSTPYAWKKKDKTTVLIHGMGGSSTSNYMIRMARKLYALNHKVIRVNLRNCGSGYGLSKLPYCAGNSQDILKVLLTIHKKFPSSSVQLIGYSLGGNICLKLAGEMGDKSPGLVNAFIAICPPLNLEHSMVAILDKKNRLYHAYYMRNVLRQGRPWIKDKMANLLQIDDQITGPLWGFQNAKEYYQKCSCINYLHSIKTPAHILLAKDDPFVPLVALSEAEISEHVNIWTTERGSHMGFLSSYRPKKALWLDNLIIKWAEETH